MKKKPGDTPSATLRKVWYSLQHINHCCNYLITCNASAKLYILEIYILKNLSSIGIYFFFHSI